jgi:hypothetical protein
MGFSESVVMGIYSGALITEFQTIEMLPADFAKKKVELLTSTIF